MIRQKGLNSKAKDISNHQPISNERYTIYSLNIRTISSLLRSRNFQTFSTLSTLHPQGHFLAWPYAATANCSNFSNFSTIFSNPSNYFPTLPTFHPLLPSFCCLSPSQYRIATWNTLNIWRWLPNKKGPGRSEPFTIQS